MHCEFKGDFSLPELNAAIDYAKLKIMEKMGFREKAPEVPFVPRQL